jgi:hypothetical protein
LADKIVAEHYQKHSITEWEHIPDHNKRRETLQFRNAKHQLEDIEHLGCYVCGIKEHLESHHILERCWANAYDLRKVAYFLFNHYDFHGHVKRDFKDAHELYQFLLRQDSVEEALDTIYNQLILCKEHHRVEGHSVHGSSFATFCAMLSDKDDQFKIALSPKEYEQLNK